MKKYYAVIAECVEAIAYNGDILTEKNEKVWLVKCEWVPATSSYCSYSKTVPKNVLVWETKEEAEEFARNWQGHPWFCKPNGNYEIVELKEKFKTISVGWERND